MIWVGTSGFQYPEWRGTFYPEKFSTAKMLPYYSERFASTEINYSFRRIPSEKTLARWDAETPAQFSFSLKAPQTITHFAKLRNCEEKLSYFLQAIADLGSKRGAILFQLPPSFKCDLEVLSAFLPSLPKNARAVFEFRHASWLNETVFALLREHQAALCIAESDSLTTPAVTTADYAYLRLRREDYEENDLARWAEFAATLSTRETYVYFKHEEQGVGPQFAARFIELLRGHGATLPPAPAAAE